MTATPDPSPPASFATSTPRPGLHLLTATDGAQIGTVSGDYVIGFTARYMGLVRRFDDLDEAQEAIVAEYLRQQSPPPLGDPSDRSKP